MMRLQQQLLFVRSKLDRAYDDRLSGRISDDLWSSKSAELEAELQRVRAEMGRHEKASHRPAASRTHAKRAYSLYVTQNPHEQARLVKTLRSNCTFDRGSLTPTYILMIGAARQKKVDRHRLTTSGTGEARQHRVSELIGRVLDAPT